MSENITYTKTITTTTTLTAVPTEVFTYIPISENTTTTTEITTLTETSTLTTVETRTKTETTYAVDFVKLTTTETTTAAEVWDYVETVKNQLIETTTTTEVTTAEWITETFTYSEVFTEDLLGLTKTLTTIETTTLITVPLDPRTTTEAYLTKELVYVGVGETTTTITTSIEETTTTTYSTTTLTSITINRGYFKAGTVVSLNNVDDYAELWMKTGSDPAVCVGVAESNGEREAYFVPGHCAYTIPKDGFYDFSIRNHDNRYGGISNIGNIDFNGELTYNDETFIETITLKTTTAKVSYEGFTETVILADIYTESVVERVRTIILPWDGATSTTQTITTTTGTELQDVITVIGTTEVCRTVYGEIEKTQLTTTESEIPTIIEDSIRTTVFTCVGQTVTTWHTWTEVHLQEIYTTQTYVYSAIETVVPQQTLTTTTTLVSFNLVGEILTQTTGNTLAVTTTTTETWYHYCLGGVYYGFTPIEETFYNEAPCTAIKQGRSSHRHIF